MMKKISKSCLVLFAGLALLLTACTVSGFGQNSQTNSLTPAATLTATSAPTATPEPTATSTPTPTPNATAAAKATIQAISDSVYATDPFNPDAYAQIEATVCAVIPPPTPTPLPWKVKPNDPTVNEIGNCLHGAGIWSDGYWLSASNYTFANPNDLRAAQQVYEEHFDFISFRNGPPAENFNEELAHYMLPKGSYSAVTQAVTSLRQQGYYIRVTVSSLAWSEDVYLDLDQLRLSIGWSAKGAVRELVDIKTNQVIKRKQAWQAGHARLVYDPKKSRWFVLEDEDGIYTDPFYAAPDYGFGS
jgi:hypothetical protein